MDYTEAKGLSQEVLSNIYTYMRFQKQISIALDEVVSLQNENANLKKRKISKTVYRR